MLEDSLGSNSKDRIDEQNELKSERDQYLKNYLEIHTKNYELEQKIKQLEKLVERIKLEEIPKKNSLLNKVFKLFRTQNAESAKNLLLQIDNSNLEKKLRENTKQCQQSENKLKKLREKYNNDSKKSSKIQNEISELEEKLRESSEKCQQSNDNLTRLRENNSILQKENSKLQKFKNSLSNISISLQKENSELQDKLRENFKKYQQSEDNLTRLRNKYDEYFKKHSMLQQENSKLEEKFRENSEKCQQSEDHLTRLRDVHNKKNSIKEISDIEETPEEISEKDNRSDNLTKLRSELEEYSSGLKEELEDLRKEKSYLEETLAGISEKHRQSETRLRSELDECSNENSALKENLKEISETYERSKLGLEELRKEKSYLEETLAGISEKHRQSEDTLTKLHSKLEECSNGKSELQEKFEKLSKKCEQSKEELEELRKEKSLHEKTVREISEKHRQSETRLRSELDECSNENSALKENLKEISETYERSKLGLEELRKEKSYLEETLAGISEKHRQSEDTLTKLRSEHEECSNGKSKLQEKFEKISKKFEQSKEQLEELHKEKSLLEVTIRKITENHKLDLERFVIQNEVKYEDVLNKLSQKDSKIHELQQKFDETNKGIKDLKNVLDNKEKEKRELLEKNSKLKTEASKYQAALGNVTTFRMNDDDKNHSVQLVNDILSLRDMLKTYVTSLKGKIEIDTCEINKLLREHNIKTTKQIDYSLIKAVLQFHTLMKIMENVKIFFKNFSNSSSALHLEADIMSKSKTLEERLVEFSKTRNGKDSVTQTTSIKIRQEVNIALSNRGFSDVLIGNDVPREHDFISDYKDILNEEMNKYRTIKDPAKKKTIENLAPKLIREIIRLIWFRLQIQEPVAQIEWVPVGSDIDPNVMEGIWDSEDIEHLEVEVCTFPMIGRDLNNLEKRVIYTHAQVFTRNKSLMTKTLKRFGMQ
ncbi:6264_t:CDS:1 [Funneliformis mosseae]|uniref:6264_t:CDS:1 n=1 Tax=Funneliformis mosseae TaxID=27381 RepID=A0A9N9E0C6_FUNMO|nr:6264_t:CDS:1 [Funneliformis mosseae]